MPATYGFASPAAANASPSGIASVVTDLIGSKSDTLSDISETKFTQTHSVLKDSNGREKVHALTAEASWRFHLMDGIYLPLLSTFCGGFHNTSLNLINGDKVVFGNTAVGHNGAIKCKLHISGNTAEDRYVEMGIKRSAVISSSFAAILDNDILWSTFTSAASSPLFTGGAAYRSAAGVKAFSVRGADTWEEIGVIKDSNFMATFMYDEDSEGRYNPRNTVMIEYSVDVMNLHATGSVNVLDTFHQYASNDCKFQLMDNTLITCADILGAVADPIFDGDVDKSAIIRFHGSGEILTSAWAGLITIPPPD